MDNYIIPRPSATIQQLKDAGQCPNDNVIRVYCWMYPNVFNFQIRTHAPINFFGSGKPRDMIASAFLTIEEVEALLAAMKRYAATHDFAEDQQPPEPEPVVIRCRDCNRVMMPDDSYCPCQENIRTDHGSQVIHIQHGVA